MDTNFILLVLEILILHAIDQGSQTCSPRAAMRPARGSNAARELKKK